MNKTRGSTAITAGALLLGLGAFLAVTMTGCAMGNELYRITVDMDGDGKPEQVGITIAPAQEDWRSQAVISIGPARYAAEFFSAERDLPHIRLVQIDRKRPQQQLLLEAPEAGTCVFHLLAYGDGKITPLLRFDSGPDCIAPQPLGNGEVAVRTWQGFWTKEDRYRLSDDGTSLIGQPEKLYWTGAAGFAATEFPLQGAECPARPVAAGAYLKVRFYDPESDRYRIESSDGGCGWIPADAVKAFVDGLPWAG